MTKEAVLAGRRALLCLLYGRAAAGRRQGRKPHRPEAGLRKQGLDFQSQRLNFQSLLLKIQSLGLKSQSLRLEEPLLGLKNKPLYVEAKIYVVKPYTPPPFAALLYVEAKIYVGKPHSSVQRGGPKG